VVMNKVDRDTSRVEEVENEIFDLFCLLEADDSQLDYPLVYSSARSGWAINELKRPREGVSDLLESVIKHIPYPKVDCNDTLKMLITQTESNKFFGKMVVGRIHSGSISVGEKIQSIDSTGSIVEAGKVLKIIKKFGVH
jgi:GTP-binding protein